MRDYYGLLGLKSGADAADIKRSYRVLAVKYHPDKNPDPAAAEKFISITEAYEVLSDRKKRAEYDLMRWELAKRDREKQETFSTVEPPRESLSSRRTKARVQRSRKYHSTSVVWEKRGRQVMECGIIVSHYIFHGLGMLLAGLMIYSAINQLPKSMASGIGILVGTIGFACLLAYGVFWLAKQVVLGIRTEVKSYSAFFSLNHSLALGVTVLLYALCMALIAKVFGLF